MEGICLNCGKVLKERQRKFCCIECEEYYDKHQTFEQVEAKYYRQGIPIREFVCANPDCGKFVYVRDPRDKRTRFCCGGCREEYFKHPLKHKRGVSRIGALTRKTMKAHKEVIYIRQCEWCGKTFKTKYETKKYCSKKCKVKAKIHRLREKERQKSGLDV